MTAVSKVEVLAWKTVDGPYVAERWYGYIKDQSLAISCFKSVAGVLGHDSVDCSTVGAAAPVYAANVLDGWTFASKGDLVLEPTVFLVQAPPACPVKDGLFIEWVEECVMGPIERALDFSV